jgi:hypothetical protein
MATQSKTEPVHEVVGVFHNADNLESAIDDLLNSGFYRSELSVVANETAVAEKLGAFYRAPSELADDPFAARAASGADAAFGDGEAALIGVLEYVGATVALGAVIMSGALGPAITTAVLARGTGRLIGAVFARWVGPHHAAYLRDQIDDGGLLLWVRAMNLSDEARASEIVGRHTADEHQSPSIFALRA